MSVADGVETSETRKDAEQYLELAMCMSCDQRLKNALEGKNYREAYSELSRRIDRDADVDYVTKLTSFTWKKGDDMDFEQDLDRIEKIVERGESRGLQMRTFGKTLLLRGVWDAGRAELARHLQLQGEIEYESVVERIREYMKVGA